MVSTYRRLIESATPMPNFYTPIPGLTVVTPWHVGPVTFMPVDEGLAEVESANRESQPLTGFSDSVREANAGAIARTETADKDAAFERVASAVDVLRIFQHVHYYTSKLPHFGMPGDLPSAGAIYAVTGGERPGYGYGHRGEFVGWTFSDAAVWPSDATFNAVASAIGDDGAREGMRRALIGIESLSAALVEQRPTLKMVGLVTALEAWLLPRTTIAQTYRLARSAAFFGCGGHSGDLCGRARDTCLYLSLEPDAKADRAQLKRLRDHRDVPWLCSEWNRVVDWYDVRSDVVHGAGPRISTRQADQSLFWVLRYLARPILDWLVTHPTSPVDDLDQAMHALPRSPDWERLLGAPLP
jgi:hypothetical protein